MCLFFGTSQSSSSRDKLTMERLLDLNRKIRAKLCKEIFGHSIAVITFSGLVIYSIVEILKSREPDGKKLLAALLGIGHFGLCATAILHLKYCAVMEMNPLKCKIWVYLEVYNIAATTAFIVVATRHLLPPPFHQWTGTALLLIIYWLPLIMYKISQICRMLEFVHVLSYWHDAAVEPIRKRCYDNVGHNFVRVTPCATKTVPCTSVPLSNHNRPPFTTTAASGPAVVPPILPISKPISSSHIPYELVLIDSLHGTLP